MNEDYKVYKGVNLGEGSNVGPWVILGFPPKGRSEGELELHIGERAVIRSHTVIYAGSKIGSDFATGHGSLIRERVTVGDNVSIGSATEIEQDTKIGNNVRIHSHCFLAEGTEVEDNVRIAPGVNMASDRHPLLPAERKVRKGPRIEQGVYIGMGATILPGITIGKGSFVGAGSVVTKDVPEGVVVIGNPARIFMTVEEYLAKLK